ncbi:MAG: zinc dependent phospholipase C family protein [Eubacteriales bacterium]
MRKKAHISLANLLLQHHADHKIIHHRKAFCIGNILPDCKPSFFTKKHAFDHTFEEICEQIVYLSTHPMDTKKQLKQFAIQLGEVTHHLADYFTFVHHAHFDGSLKEHCTYEGKMNHFLKDFIKNTELMLHLHSFHPIEEIQELLFHIEQAHHVYTMQENRSMHDDCAFIIYITSQVMKSILHYNELYHTSTNHI